MTTTETPTIVYRVRHATGDDLDTCLGLRTHAEQWLRHAGIEQWTDSSVGDRDIRAAVNDGSLFVVTTANDADVVGCLALNGPDQDFWAPHECVQPALYLYKLIVRTDRRRTGLGDMLMDWACRRAHESGARWLRMDCWKSNTKLQQYYLDRGFEHLDTRTADGRKSGWLAQRDVTVRTSDPAAHGIMLVDDSNPARPAALPLDNGDLYDPTGEVALWQDAASRVTARKLDQPPASDTAWNDALDQAARDLDVHARELRQSNGMYYRPLTGEDD